MPEEIVEMEYYPILTAAGEAKEIECLLGETAFDIQEIAVGDGNGSLYEPEKSQTALKNECWRGLIDTVQTETNQDGSKTLFAVVHVPVEVAGFTIREAGIFDKSGNLLIVCKVPETIKREPATGDIKQISIRVDLSVINELALPFLIDPSINTATVEYCDKHYQNIQEKGQPDGYAPLNEDGYVPREHIQSSFVPFCVNSGPIEDGVETLLSLSEDGNTITAKAPFALTSAEGETRTINDDLQLDVSSLQDGKHTILYNFETGALEAFPKTIHTGKKFPDEAVIGDMLFDISVAPYTTKIKTTDGFEYKKCVQMGLCERVSEERK